MTGTDTLLSLEGVSKGFPGVQALDNMRLDVRYGEVLALVGENGAGKSTLMKLLSGLYTPDSGTFTLDGEDYTPSGPRHAEELGISIIHQEFHLMPDLSVAQNIFIGREPRRAGLFTDDRRLNEMARELLDRLGLDLDPREPVHRLTVAKQQMVEIAKALSSSSTKVLIMDEPTAALNDAEVATLHELIRRFISPSTAVIYISHRMDELSAISDRITVIRDGLYVTTVETATTSMPEVIAHMVGREIDTSVGPQNVRADREVILAVEGLHTKELLQDVSFELRKGEILGFAGLMGAGRTEVARAIVGADPITDGTITLHGKPVRIPHPARAAEYGIGYLSEDRKRFGLMLNLAVSNNIALSSLSEHFSAAGFVRDRDINRVSRTHVDTLGVRTPSIKQVVGNLSGGNQQKVVIAKWLAKDCDVLIFDEPTRGIDVGAKDEIYRLLNELAAAGKSIIMISSELPEVLRMAHRVVVMSEGRVTGELESGDVTQENVMHLATLRPESESSRGSVTTEAGLA
ncbi:MULTISPECIES: sugar ABC transporter ATP-binding protein [unclassified Pseudactinotalea]|uniref:sugar ABC transporter ATP-binding protein n=1 Tax=unclassified Pseudactinotalea TaxID=2649176 RepID=UPI00128D4E55|nr:MULTISPECIES: sugar ABC transporter ATP-binding protein [unclassified Pseudactinotalea]MPV50582.1 ATP-binding cassette domain-containing protein [Pseudactinotalea sp. HY160]QGH70740.1 ATP-binding cassette domain-containing protein [Pseudactinotalea sp. HY158]